MRGIQLALIGIVCAMAVGCGQPNPQRPSRRMGQPQVDTMALNLMKFNQRMREEADKTLQAKAQRDPNERYALYQWGAWIHVIEPGNEEAGKPELGKECELHMRIYSLDGHLYCDDQRTVTLAKYELPVAVEWNVAEWYHGAKLKMLVPWYSAYGIQGTDAIPPYENVMIELDIK
jgi:hypothetical protein